MTDHKLHKVHLVAANRSPDTVKIVDEITSRWKKASLSSESFSLTHPFKPLISKEEYRQAISAIQQDLIRGRFYQVNFTQPFLGEYRGNPWEMYKRIRINNPVPYSAFLRSTEGDVLSFSPERFLLMEAGRVQTSPIKGTIKCSSKPRIDQALREYLQQSTKNRAENVMIVDLLRNDFGKFAKIGTVKTTSLCDVESYHGLHHLVSTVTAEYAEDVTPLDVFKACFPGGSITGAPKVEAMKMIREQERYSRGVYCGSIAYFSNHGRFDSNIAIRTLTAKPNTLYLSAGGGIVIDSNWEEEYLECFTKIQAILHEFRPKSPG